MYITCEVITEMYIEKQTDREQEPETDRVERAAISPEL